MAREKNHRHQHGVPGESLGSAIILCILEPALPRRSI